MNLDNCLIDLMVKNNLTYLDLEKLTGIPKTSIFRYCKEKYISDVPKRKLELLATALNTTVEELYGMEKGAKVSFPIPEREQYSDKELDILERIKSLPNDRQEEALRYIQFLSEK